MNLKSKFTTIIQIKFKMNKTGGEILARKLRAKLKPYNGLNENFTQVANSMLTYIKDPYAFKIYFYLCMRYNNEYDYAFPSLTTIAKDCQMSLDKVKKCIKWLEENECIEKHKYIKEHIIHNKYSINYYEYKDENDYVCYVYVHKNKESKEVLYIGKGTGGRAYDFTNRNKKYLEYINEIGKENIEVNITKTFHDDIEAFEYEKYLTNKYKKENQARFNIIVGNIALQNK